MMKKLCLYTKNSRLLQRWNELLQKEYTVESFSTFESLQEAISEDVYVLFHDQSDEHTLIEEIDKLHANFTKKNTLILRDVPSLDEGEKLLSHDIGGYGNANMSDDILLQAVTVLCSENVWFYPDFMSHIISKINRSNTLPQSFDILTAREKEVATLVAKGETNQQIAEDLAIALNTVKLHISSIFEKLSIKSRVALALLVSKAS